MLCFVFVFCFVFNILKTECNLDIILLVLDREQPFQTKNNYIFNRVQMVYDLKLKTVRSSLRYSSSFVALEKSKSSTIWAIIMHAISSSKHTRHPVHAKLEEFVSGAFGRPNGMTVNRHSPSPVVKAVFSLPF